HSTCRLIANACTINTDAVHSGLFDLTPDRLSKIDLVKRDIDVTARPDEEDLSRRSRVGFGYVDTNNRSEAVSYIGNIGMIDRRNPSCQRLPPERLFQSGWELRSLILKPWRFHLWQ